MGLGPDEAIDVTLALVAQFVSLMFGPTPDSEVPTLFELARRLASLEYSVGEVLRAHGNGQKGQSGISPKAPVETGPLPMPYTIQVGERSRYLDASGAAAYLGITMSSLYGIVERGHLNPLRGPRRRYRFTVAMLDEYLKGRRRE